MRGLVISLLAMMLAACGQSVSDAPPAPPLEEEAPALSTASLNAAPVDAALLAAPNSEFMAIEPTEVGVVGAADVLEAIAPLISEESVGEGETLTVSVRDISGGKVADIVRNGLQDDSIGAAQVRIEFRREPDGWYPTNAYRRAQCRRAADPNAWSVAPCP